MREASKRCLRIANAHKNARNRESTTCPCVVLRNKDGHAKKLVFHNGKDKMSATMEQKARELKYAIRTGYKAHAEGELLQCLLQRMQQNQRRYTHILGMRCSRLHCKECDCLLKLFLGTNYHEFTAAMCIEGDLVPPTITDRNEKDGFRIQTDTHYKVVHQEEIVSSGGKRSNRYYLPEALKDRIRFKTNCQGLDFSDERFEIKEEVVQRMGKKRKIDKKATHMHR